MLPIDKGRIAYLGSVERETRIVAEFNESYVAAGEPDGMALLSHYIRDGLSALSITPESIPYCASFFKIAEWSEYDTCGLSARFAGLQVIID
jgi:hypothetical protein